MQQAVADAIRAARGDLQQRVRLNEERINFIDGHNRKRTAALLFLGAIFGLLGFAFAFVIGLIKFLEPADYEGHVFPSGQGYFPPTVSEMVHDPRDPAGKAFFGFEFTAALFIFMSWYPWELRNVYMGDDDIAFCGISWVMLRQFIPAPGMMLVATVTSTPIAQATLLDWFTIGIHLTGALMMFAGYVIIEGKTLGWCGLARPKAAMHISGVEFQVRRFLLSCIGFWYAIFFALQIVIAIPNLPICCADKWGVPEDAPPHALPELQDTATGTMLMLKVLSYISEVLCGLCLICSHLVIWYFCKERHVDLAEELCEILNTAQEGGYRRLPDGQPNEN